MALPALPANLVPRYKLRYTVASQAHSTTIHMATNGTSADAVTNGTALANLLKPIMPTNCSFVGIDYAAAGSNVFNPVATLSIAGTAGGTTVAPYDVRALSFVGRNLNGRKTRLFMIGAFYAFDNNWRIETSENTAVAAIVTGLNAGTGGVCCIDGVQPVWKTYANMKVMDHYVKKDRQGAG